MFAFKIQVRIPGSGVVGGAGVVDVRALEYLTASLTTELVVGFRRVLTRVRCVVFSSSSLTLFVFELKLERLRERFGFLRLAGVSTSFSLPLKMYFFFFKSKLLYN